MKSIILILALLVLRTSARPLIWEQPWYEFYKTQAPQPEDNPYGPVEVSANVGNYYHAEGDKIHNDDLWPPLAPPAAVRRAEPASVVYGPTATPDILAPYRLLCHSCPPGVAPLPAPSMLSTAEGPSTNTTPTLEPTSTKEVAAFATGAQKWQEYWAHNAAVSPVPTLNMTTSSKSNTTKKPIAISTGAQQWQVYWDHATETDKNLTDKAKFDFFVTIFAVPHHLTTAMIAMSRAVAQVYPQSMFQEQETQTPGTDTIIALCDTIGRIIPQDKIQEEFTEEMGFAMITTCNSLAVLFPEGRIQSRASTLHTDIHIEDPIRQGGIALPPLDTDATETHNEDDGTPSHVSPSASVHRPAVGTRGFYMFQPLETAYTWLNDMFTLAIDQHPRWPYNYPEEHIFGCIYKPSWDSVAKDQIICPPDGRDGEQGVDVRSYPETAGSELVDRRAAESALESAVAFVIEMIVNFLKALTIGRRSVSKRPEPHQKRYFLESFFKLFSPRKDDEPTPTAIPERRDVSAAPLQERDLMSFLNWLFVPKPAPEIKFVDGPAVQAVEMEVAETKERSEYAYARVRRGAEPLDVTDPDASERVEGGEELEGPVTPINPKDAYGPAMEWVSADGAPLMADGSGAAAAAY